MKRGARLKARFGVNGSQNALRSLGTLVVRFAGLRWSELSTGFSRSFIGDRHKLTHSRASWNGGRLRIRPLAPRLLTLAQQRVAITERRGSIPRSGAMYV